MRPTLGILLISLLLTAPVPIRARQASARSPQNASYTLDVTLDPVNQLLTGRGRLAWRNTSNQPASDLRFHLFWNAWRDAGSTWMRESRRAGSDPLRGRSEGDRGLIDIGSLTVAGQAGGANLISGARYIAPDDGNGDDRTLLQVPLPQPVMPGASIELEMTWSAHVPRPFDRTGVTGRTYMVAQWFPKIGVLDDTGWQAHEFHADTEFFADFGRYDVRITVPTGWVVGATGAPQDRIDRGNGTTTHRFIEQDVHDFAWTTSPDYVERTDRFDQPGAAPVSIRLLLQPEHVEQADRHFTAAKATLAYYTSLLGPYPWAQLTMVDPVTVVNPRLQGVSTGGMEYPTLVTIGTRWLTPWTSDEPESTAIHEIGHQFWQGAVATDEVDHAWMDEGLTTFTSARVQAEALPNRFVRIERYFGGLVAWPYVDVPWTASNDGLRLATYREAPGRDALATPSWQLDPKTGLATTYARTALWLSTLERVIGDDAMRRVLAQYYARGLWQHPSPEAFIEAASSASGQDLTWFFDATYRHAGTFDYAVGPVTTTETDSGSTDSAIVLRRIGDGVFPVDVRVTFADGDAVVERWDGRDSWHALRYRRGAPAVAVEIDPDRVLQLDAWRTNNSWSARPTAERAATKWSLRWLTWFQHMLMTYAFFV